MYKSKVEEMSNLREKIKYLEKKNAELFNEKLELERECKQVKLLQTQIDFQKQLNQELNQQTRELNSLADKREHEKQSVEEKLNIINKEKNVRELFYQLKYISYRSHRI